jgi:RNA polymerase sigma factor (sigma-70 family)
MPPHPPVLLDLLIGDHTDSDIRAALFHRVRAGVAAALGYRTAHAVPPDREDIVQEATLAALRNVVAYRHNFRGDTEASAAAWLRVLTRNVARTQIRRDSRRRSRIVTCDPGELELLARPRHPGEEEPTLSREEAHALLERVVPNGTWREMWLLYHDPARRHSHEELARRYGRTPGTVAVTLSHVRRAIAGALA